MHFGLTNSRIWYYSIVTMWHLLEERRLFQCEYPKVQRLLEGDAYMRPGAYLRKYGIRIFLKCPENVIFFIENLFLRVSNKYANCYIIIFSLASSYLK